MEENTRSERAVLGVRLAVPPNPSHHKLGGPVSFGPPRYYMSETVKSLDVKQFSVLMVNRKG